MGRGFTIERLRNPRIPMEDHHAAAQEALAFAREAIHSGKYQMVILDEIMASIHGGHVSLEQVLSWCVRSHPCCTWSSPGAGRPRS